LTAARRFVSTGNAKNFTRRLFGCIDCRLRHAVVHDVEEADRRARFADFVRYSRQSLRVAGTHAGKVDDRNAGHGHCIAPWWASQFN
jgi:hypothetical protein